jgi:hypothetical protein
MAIGLFVPAMIGLIMAALVIGERAITYGWTWYTRQDG